MPLQIYQEKEQSNKKPINAIIGIAAGKGGVGKSTVTVNLALALKQMGYQVGILDADIYGPSTRKMLSDEKMPIQRGQNIVPAISKGIKFISMAYFRKEHEAAVVRAPIANGIITQFLQNIEWGNLDYLLIDFPPGTGDVQLTLCQQANLTGAILVTTPQEVAVMDVRKAKHLFEQVKIPIIGVIENMSYYQHAQSEEKVFVFGRGGGEKLAQSSGLPFLGNIPVESCLSECGDKGRSIFEHGSQTSVETFLGLANNVILHLNLIDNSSVNCMRDFELIWKEMD